MLGDKRRHRVVINYENMWRWHQLFYLFISAFAGKVALWLMRAASLPNAA